RDHDDAISIGNDDVARHDQYAAHYDGTVHRFHLVPAGADTAPWVPEIQGHMLRDDLVGVARGRVGDHADTTALHPRENVVRPDRTNVRVGRVLEHERGARSQQLHEGFARARVVELANPTIEVRLVTFARRRLLCRHVARRDGDADEPVFVVPRVL